MSLSNNDGVGKHLHQLQDGSKVRGCRGFESILPQPSEPSLLGEFSVTDEYRPQRREVQTPILRHMTH
jgi:hypothetical protein